VADRGRNAHQGLGIHGAGFQVWGRGLVRQFDTFLPYRAIVNISIKGHGKLWLYRMHG
jgi:hypothetical protein